MNIVRNWLIFSFFSLIGLDSSAQIKTFNESGLQEDFDIFRGSLEELHPGLYWYRSKHELDNVFEIAATKLNHPMSEHEYLRVLGSVISKIGCGHTQLR